MSKRKLPPAFVTFGWCRSAYTVCRALSVRGVDVHVGDSSPLAMTRFSRYAKSFSRLPNFFLSPTAYVKAVVAAMDLHKAEVLLPCSEDIEVLLSHREEMPPHIRVALPTLADWRVAEDKFDYLQVVEKAGCAVPFTLEVGDLSDLDVAASQVGFPLVLKVRNGNGSRGVGVVRDIARLRSLFRRFVDEYGLPPTRWPVLQQYINGEKLQMDGVFVNGDYSRDGVYKILRAKGASLFGTSTYRVTVERPDVQESASRALRALNWNGIFNLDWLCDASGGPFLIDINGRLGGAVSILYEAGLDLPWYWYQLARGCTPLDPHAAKVGVATKWLLGEALALVEHVAAGNFREGLAIMGASSPAPVAYDDFSWRDPLPLCFEALDYLFKFTRARGSLRPTVKGMVR